MAATGASSGAVSTSPASISGAAAFAAFTKVGAALVTVLARRSERDAVFPWVAMMADGASTRARKWFNSNWGTQSALYSPDFYYTQVYGWRSNQNVCEQQVQGVRAGDKTVAFQTHDGVLSVDDMTRSCWTYCAGHDVCEPKHSCRHWQIGAGSSCLWWEKTRQMGQRLCECGVE